ncbi:outer membrane protein [Devosia sp.]|uniref:outer membrane protein n=1 Tax=Devosia sp. TaxID=1871048 RepID=UPI003A8F7980
MCATSVIAISASAVAQAQDMSGFYAGIHAGAAMGTLSGNVTANNGSGVLADADSLGPVAGVQLGYNFATGSDLLIGAELSASFGHASDSQTLENFGNASIPRYVERELTGLALAQGKFGWSTGDLSLYGLAGVAVATGTLSDTEGSASYSGDTFYNGWTLGAGIDLALTENVSIGAAYNYVDLSATDTEPTGTIVEQELDSHIGKLVLNYHF